MATITTSMAIAIGTMLIASYSYTEPQQIYGYES